MQCAVTKLSRDLLLYIALQNNNYVADAALLKVIREKVGGIGMEFGVATEALFQWDLWEILSSTVGGAKTLDTAVIAVLSERSRFGIN